MRVDLDLPALAGGRQHLQLVAPLPGLAFQLQRHDVAGDRGTCRGEYLVERADLTFSRARRACPWSPPEAAAGPASARANEVPRTMGDRKRVMGRTVRVREGIT